MGDLVVEYKLLAWPWNLPCLCAKIGANPLRKLRVGEDGFMMNSDVFITAVMYQRDSLRCCALDKSIDRPTQVMG